MDKIVESKICRLCSVSFDVTDLDLEFYDKVSPIFNGVKYQIPSPTLCPECRQQRRLTFRNERKLYHRKCDLTGKQIISIYSPDKPYKIYDHAAWWSDKWNALNYSKEFDFSRSFFEQFDELMKNVPLIGLFLVKSMENSDYCNFGLGCKDCYLCINSYESEKSFYSHTSMFGYQDNDGWMNTRVNNSYYSQYCNNSSNIFYSQYCDDCTNVWYCENCKNCENCIGCSNISGKKYFVFNKEVEKNVFEVYLNKIKNQDKEFLNSIDAFLRKSIKKDVNNTNCENCTGDNMQDSKNIFSCFDTISSENSKYCYLSGYLSNNMYDGMNIGGESQYLYEGHHSHYSNKCSFVLDSDYNNDCYYISHCFNSSHLFGCIGLRNSQYCILNKQYTKEEYETLVPKIIEHMQETGEWGEFFPSSISPFGYNETVAMEYYPLSREQILRTGPETSNSTRTGPGFLHGPIFNYSTYEPPTPQVSKTIPSSKLPDNIKDIPDDILNWAIIPDDEDNQDIPYRQGTALSQQINKPFRIIKQELEFYKKHNIPIPKKHPDQRHLDRMKLRNPRKLYDRNCDKCNTPIKTTYNPEREEIVYCEQCYNREVY